ncbi:MAG: hypothetical protein NC548_38665 [Lachnospiraceae bacterium]|nr:hypothetical protein [Lachnospiraceae bacterium]
MRRKRKRKLRRLRKRNIFVRRIWDRVFATVRGVTFDEVFSGGDVQMNPVRGPTY